MRFTGKQDFHVETICSFVHGHELTLSSPIATNRALKTEQPLIGQEIVSSNRFTFVLVRLLLLSTVVIFPLGLLFAHCIAVNSSIHHVLPVKVDV